MAERKLDELRYELRALVKAHNSSMLYLDLLRVYRRDTGGLLPIYQFGYKYALSFLREKCRDLFTFQGDKSNPWISLPGAGKRPLDPEQSNQALQTSEQILNELRYVLISLVKSHGSSMLYLDLLQEYRQEVGGLLPIYHFGYKSPLPFLRDKCRDFFKFEGDPSNPRISLPGAQKPSEEEEEEKENPSDPIEPSKQLRQNVSRTYYKKAHESEPEKTPPAPFRNPESAENDQILLNDYCTRLNEIKEKELKREIFLIVKESEEPVRALSLIRLYWERYHRNLSFPCFGYWTVKQLLRHIPEIEIVSESGPNWLLRDAALPPLPPPDPEPELKSPSPEPEPSSLICIGRCQSPTPTPRPEFDLDEALPGIDFAPDVFPGDCMQLDEIIEPLSLTELLVGDQFEVRVSEVYSPSHFWFYRVGKEYDSVVRDFIQGMTAYYVSSEGKNRRLAGGAVREGHYCAAMYFGEWHRSVIVKKIDDDYVMVRHVDIGTMNTVTVGSLRPLLRLWATLPAQAIRGRLAAVRPSSVARRWPHAASIKFSSIVKNCSIKAIIAAIEEDGRTLEVFLTKNQWTKKSCISRQMIYMDYAANKYNSVFEIDDCYLHPSFNAIESGTIASLEEVDEYLRTDVETFWEYGPTCFPIEIPQFPPQFDRPFSPPQVDQPCSSKELDRPCSQEFPLFGIDFGGLLSDYMELDEIIPEVSLSELHPGYMFAVTVVEVFSPSAFWFNHLGKEHIIAAENIMDTMMEYFESHKGRDLRLPRHAVRVGQFCAALCNDYWHRAVIVKSIDDEYVMVRYVDYGTVSTVAIELLRPLLREWTKLPMQAIRGRLAGVCPAFDAIRWPYYATQKFFKRAYGRRLAAEVAAINKNEKTVEMFLIDTSTESDEWLHVELIRRGLATACPDLRLWAANTPSFNELEMGDGLSVDDSVRLPGDYVQIYQQNEPPRPTTPQALDRPANVNGEEEGDRTPDVCPQHHGKSEAARKARTARKRRQRAAKAARKRANELPPPPPPYF